MALRRAQIQIQTTADVSGANQAAAAMGNLNAATGRAAAGTKNIGAIAGQAGFQIQDFAVQVGGGTSALTAFAQQAPQLLGVFGPAGAIAGAIVAVGAVATKIFLTMANDAKEAGEAAEEVAEKMKEAFEAAAGKAANDSISNLELMTELTDILRQSEISLIEAKNKRIKSEATLLSSQQSLTEAAANYLQKTEQIQNAEEAIARSRQETARLQKEAAIADIQAGVEVERLRFENIKRQKADVQEEVDRAQARIDELQAQQSQITAQANRLREREAEQIAVGIKPEGFQSSQLLQAEAQLRNIEVQISDLFKFIDAAPSKLNDLTAEAYRQGSKIDAAVESAKMEIEAIEEKFQLSQKAETLTQASQAITSSVQEITTALSGFEPITEIQEQAKEKILQAVADGEISARDQLTINSNLQLLQSQLKTGQDGFAQSLRGLIDNQSELTGKLDAANREIQTLRSKINNLTLPVR